MKILYSSLQLNSRSSCRRGAYMVEFAYVLPIFAIMFVFLVDGYRIAMMYSRLTYATAETARYVSAAIGKIPGSPTCDFLNRRAKVAMDRIRGENDLIASFRPFTVEVRSGAAEGVASFRLLTVYGSWPIECVSCTVFARGRLLETSSTLIVEASQSSCD